MIKRNWISNRFKTKESRYWHTKTSIDSVKRLDEIRKEDIEERFNLKVRILTLGCIRITDGVKKLDLFKEKYFKVDINERGRYNVADYDPLIKDYFGLD